MFTESRVGFKCYVKYMLFFDSVHDKSLKMRVHNSIDLNIEAFWIEELRAPYSKSILKATDWKLQADWESSYIFYHDEEAHLSASH